MITLYNHVTERYMLGALMQDADLVRQLPAMSVDLMHLDAHRMILSVMQQLYASRSPVEIASISSQLNVSGQLDQVGGMPYLLDCYRAAPSTANAQYYLCELIRLMQARRAYAMAAEFCRKLTDGDDLPTAMDALRTDLRSLDSPRGSVIRMPEMISRFMDDLERRVGGEVRMLSTGLPDLDALLCGIEPVNFMLIGARPAVGKSALAMQIAMNVARRGKNVLVCSLEMSEIQYTRRMASNATGVNGLKMKSGKVGDAELAALIDGCNELAKLPIGFMFDTTTIEDLRRCAEAEKELGRLDLIMVDYLQILETSSRADKRYEEVGLISRKLKNMARELKVPVIAMAQVGRQTVSQGSARASTMPVLSDLRESGNLEQDADIIVFLHHPDGESDPSIPQCDKLNRESIERMAGHEYLVIKVAKNREASAGAFGVDYDKAHQVFTCIQH